MSSCRLGTEVGTSLGAAALLLLRSFSEASLRAASRRSPAQSARPIAFPAQLANGAQRVGLAVQPECSWPKFGSCSVTADLQLLLALV